MTSSHLDTTLDVRSLGAVLATHILQGQKAILLMMTKPEDWNLPAIQDMLIRCPVPIFGAFFPELIFDGELVNHGAIACGLKEAPPFHVVQNPSLSLSPHYQRFADCSALQVWFDEKVAGNQIFLDSIFDTFGEEKTYFGGGLGFAPSLVFSNAGLCENGSLIIGIRDSNTTVLEHGWEKFAGPLIATETSGNRLKSLNFKSALAVYQSNLARIGYNTEEPKNFLHFASSAPLGIEKFDGRILVRNILETSDSGMIFTGNILSNSVIHVLKTSAGGLLQSSKSVVNEALAKIPEPKAALVHISLFRQSFLKEKLNDEIFRIYDRLPPQCQMIGGLTSSEIINRDYAIEHHNNSVSISLLKF